MFTFKKFEKDQNNLWEEINLNSPNSSFLTSTHWIDFQNSLGVESDRYFILEDDKPVGVLYIQIFRRRIAKFAYSPYGPVVSSRLSVVSLQEFLIALRTFAKSYCTQNGLNLFRFDPIWDVSHRKDLEAAGFSKSYAPAQAIDTWQWDLSQYTSEDDLFNSIKKEHRYYIRRAVKEGVEIVKATDEDMVNEFTKLVNELTTRKNFGNHASSYFVKQWSMLNNIKVNEAGTKFCEIYLAKYKGRYISGALINGYKDTIHYSHGASSSDPEMMKLSSPYLLHWEIAKEAYHNKISKYNFWGVVPKELKNHIWRGISDFKMKFPGELVSYVGPYEVGSNPIKFGLQRLVDWRVYRKERY